jgi:DNA-directed RNA polymerase subunit K
MKDKDSYSKYEKTKIISARALQLAQGSPAMVDVPKDVTDPIRIAKMEWEKNLIPIGVKREK